MSNKFARSVFHIYDESDGQSCGRKAAVGMDHHRLSMQSALSAANQMRPQKPHTDAPAVGVTSSARCRLKWGTCGVPASRRTYPLGIVSKRLR